MGLAKAAVPRTLGFVLLLWASVAAAQDPVSKSIEVRSHVVTVTSREVYLDRGRKAGLRAGDRASIALPNGSHFEARVADVAEKAARIPLEESQALPIRGAKVIVFVTPPDTSTMASTASAPPPTDKGKSPAQVASKPSTLKKRRAAKSDSDLARLWRGVDLSPKIATRKSVAAKAKAKDVAKFSASGTLRAEYLGTFNFGEAPQEHYQEVGLYSQLALKNLGVANLNYTHRLRLRLHLAHDLDVRPFPASRASMLVYQLQLAYRRGPFAAQLGRIYASPTTASDAVDGAAVAASPWPWLTLGAYGGLQPRLSDLVPSADGSHFGGHVAFHLGEEPALGGDWSIAGHVGFVGSTWQGQVDRKAISTQLLFNHRMVSFFADAVVDFYAKNPALDLPTASLTTLSAQATVTPRDWLRFGVRFDRYRQQLTLEMLNTLPTDYLTTPPVHVAGAWINVDFPREVSLAVHGGWSLQGDSGHTGWTQTTAQICSLLVSADRLHLSFATHHGQLLSRFGGRAGYEIPLLQKVSLGLGYGLDFDSYDDQYNNTNWTGLRHNASLDLEWLFARRWTASVEALAVWGEEEMMLQALSTVAFHF